MPDSQNVSFTGDFFANNCIVGKTLDLSRCTGSVGLCDCDLSQIDSIKYPEQCNVFFLSNVRLPENSTLDLSKINCDTLTLEDQNCTNLRQVILPENTQIKLKGSTKLPETTARQPLMKTLQEKSGASVPKQPLMQILNGQMKARETQSAVKQIAAKNKTISAKPFITDWTFPSVLTGAATIKKTLQDV